MELKKTLYFRSVSGKTEEGETEESLHVSFQTNAYHKKWHSIIIFSPEEYTQHRVHACTLYPSYSIICSHDKKIVEGPGLSLWKINMR